VVALWVSGARGAHDGAQHQEFQYCALGTTCPPPLEYQEAPRPDPTGCPYGDSIPLDVCRDKFGWQKGAGDEGGLPNPNRDYYDQYGNRYSYDGKLIAPATLPRTGGGCK
jgi:hypothetical protein